MISIYYVLKHAALRTISYLLAIFAAISSCEAIAGFDMTGPLFDGLNVGLRIGYTCQWNITGTPPFNFDVRHRYGPYDVNSPEWKQTRVFWENSTAAVNTTNTTLTWVIPQRYYGENWSFVPYVQDSSDNQTWIRWYEQNVNVRTPSSAASLQHGTYAMGALCAVMGSVWASL